VTSPAASVVPCVRSTRSRSAPSSELCGNRVAADANQTSAPTAGVPSGSSTRTRSGTVGATAVAGSLPSVRWAESAAAIASAFAANAVPAASDPVAGTGGIGARAGRARASPSQSAATSTPQTTTTVGSQRTFIAATVSGRRGRHRHRTAITTPHRTVRQVLPSAPTVSTASSPPTITSGPTPTSAAPAGGTLVGPL
jgi:hypothetical protein